MTRKIKVNKKSCVLGVRGTTLELDPQAAKELMVECYQSGCIVVDTKKKTIIKELPPDVDEITILLSRGSFGG